MRLLRHLKVLEYSVALRRTYRSVYDFDRPVVLQFVVEPIERSGERNEDDDLLVTLLDDFLQDFEPRREVHLDRTTAPVVRAEQGNLKELVQHYPRVDGGDRFPLHLHERLAFHLLVMFPLLVREFDLPFLIDRRRKIKTILQRVSDRRLHKLVDLLRRFAFRNPLEHPDLYHEVELEAHERPGVSLRRNNFQLPITVRGRVGRWSAGQPPGRADDLLSIYDALHRLTALRAAIAKCCHFVDNYMIYVWSFFQFLLNDLDSVMIYDVKIHLLVRKQVEPLRPGPMQDMIPSVRKNLENLLRPHPLQRR